MNLALAKSAEGRSWPIQEAYPTRAPDEQTLVWLLWPSTPQALRVRSMKPSSPGRPTWYMISSWRPSWMAVRMRPPMSSSASVQLTRSHSPEPRRPRRRRGWRIRSGSYIWLMVAGPLAQFRPREPG